MRMPTMPAGRYYVGDLCYVLENEWDEFCRLTIQGNECIDGEFTLSDGRKFASFGTKWGDGGYCDQFGNEYSVDAGLIGCVQVLDTQHSVSGGHIVEFTRDFDVGGGRGSMNWDGVIHIGHLQINTDPPYSYDEEYEEES